MKRFALALLCIVSVAFFASCSKDNKVENPEPSISILAQEGYVADGDTVNVGQTVRFGFTMASNAETQKELKSLIVTANGTEWANKELTGTSFNYTDSIVYEITFDREIIGLDAITAIVTDVDGKIATASINLVINVVNLTPVDITWVRKGGDCQSTDEMAQYGLKWESRDAFHANIRPLNDNCKLYVLYENAETFNGITTEIQKALLFSSLTEMAQPVEEYRNISVAVPGDKTYNDVLAVIDAEGNQHLILFANANVQTGNFGVQTTITGQAK